MLIIGGSRSGKLIKHQRPDNNKVYLFIKDPFESKYQLLISRKEKVENQKLKNPKVFINYSQTIDDVNEHLEVYNPTKKIKVMTVFDDAIADMEANKNLRPIVTELFLRGRKHNILIVFISQCYSKVPKTKCNTSFIIKIPNKREFQEIVSNHLSDTEFKDYMKLYKDYIKKPFFFLVNDRTLPLDKPLRFKKNLL